MQESTPRNLASESRTVTGSDAIWGVRGGRGRRKRGVMKVDHSREDKDSLTAWQWKGFTDIREPNKTGKKTLMGGELMPLNKTNKNILQHFLQHQNNNEKEKGKNQKQQLNARGKHSPDTEG